MTVPLSKLPKPDAAQYTNQRKLLMVPLISAGPNAPDEAQKLEEDYWSEVRDQITNLERSLKQVTHIYHQTVFVDGEDGISLLNSINPRGGPFINTMCQSSAQLEIAEDKKIVEENADWQRCLSIGLMSNKVRTLAMESFQETSTKRYEHISNTIDKTLLEGEVGALFINEDHRIQFPSDIQVFYVAPPSLDALKRWFSDQMRSYDQPQEPSPDVDDSSERKEDTSTNNPGKE